MSHLIMDYAFSSFIFGSGLCSVSSAAGGRSPDQHIGQALLLTALGFFVREAWPPWAEGASWKNWLRQEKEFKKMRLMSE